MVLSLCFAFTKELMAGIAIAFAPMSIKNTTTNEYKNDLRIVFVNYKLDGKYKNISVSNNNLT